MKRLIGGLGLLAALLPGPVPAQEKQERAETPQNVAYYYRVRWGFQEEFERLFLKNHYPILAAEQKQGRIQSVHMFRPRFHGDGRADWTFLVVISYPSWRALGTPSDARLATSLYPDQESFQREERRRFELLEAHWDVPLEAIAPPQ